MPRVTPRFLARLTSGIVKIVLNQAQLLRKLTGEERMEQAFMLSELVRDLAVSNIKKRLGKNSTKKEVSDALRRRLAVNS